MSDFQTTDIISLPAATSISADAVVAVQEPSGPVQKLTVERLFSHVIATDTARDTEDNLQLVVAGDANEIGLVFADPDPALSGWYRSTAAGAGNWVQFENLSSQAAALVASLVSDAELARDKSQAWAEGTEPGGGGTKSAKEHAEDLAEQVDLGNAIFPLFSEVESNNIVDPSTGIDNASINTGGSMGTNTQYGRIFIPCSAGVPITVSIRAADLNWNLDQVGAVYFYNSTTTFSGATLVDRTTVGENGLAFSDDGRTLTVTPPSGAVRMGITPYNEQVPEPGSDAFDDLWRLMMGNEGSTALPYEPWVDAGTKNFPDTVLNAENKPISFVIDGELLSVTAKSWREGDYNTYQWNYDETELEADSGTVNLTGAGISDGLSAFLTAAENHRASGRLFTAHPDNQPPGRYCDTFLGGTHRDNYMHPITAEAHGLTEADLGRNVKINDVNYMLVRIKSADLFEVHILNSGADSDGWIFNTTLPPNTGTATVTGVGDIAYTAATTGQWAPMFQKKENRVIADGVRVETSGFSDEIEINEVYGVPNVARYMAYLASTIGQTGRRLLNDPANDTQVYFINRWRIDRFGTLAGLGIVRLEQSVRLTDIDYFGFMQQQSMSLGAGETLYQYVAGLNGALAGVDMHIGGLISGMSSSEVAARVENAANGIERINLFTQYKVKSSLPVHALDIGVPGMFGESRDLLERSWRIVKSSQKQYPIVADRGTLGATTAAGVNIPGFFFEAPHKMADHQNEVSSSVFLGPDGYAYRAVAFRSAVDKVFIEMPKETFGRIAEIQTDYSNTSFVVHRGGMIDADGVLVSAPAGGHAYLKVV
ncbi:hypothetical protein SPHINGOR109_90019 [Sphingorhabdus sp. 109]|nr:hypothetical protein SPHINGOR109_90019 [Sphingorhabdus sp. 109]